MMIATTATRTALAITAAGILGGLSLSSYTERGMWPRSQAASPLEVYRIPASVPAAPVQYEPQEVYICHGCGPTLAERQMQYYTYGNIAEGDYGYATDQRLSEMPADAAPLSAEEAVAPDAGTREAPAVEAPSEAELSGPRVTDSVVAYP
jgi:hypothetical protein